MKISKITLLFGLSFSLLACFDSNEKTTDEPNSPPTADSFSIVTQTEVAFTGDLLGNDPEGDPIAYASLVEPLNGNVSVSVDGRFTYRPNNEFVGTDSFSYRVFDPQNREATATVSITVETLQVSFLQFSRDSFMAASTDSPDTLNGKAFTQDANDQADYQDLIDDQ